jgi:hypothetical protein
VPVRFVVGGRFVRAFRPSQFGREDEVDEEVERAKLDNMQRYSQLAQAGLPLFEFAAQMPDSASTQVKHVR